jgi:hypothetical protein
VRELNKWGLAGVAAYGLLNTLYYSLTVSFFWFFVLKVQPGLGLDVALKKLAEAFIASWALSQVTKIPRAVGCAL